MIKKATLAKLSIGLTLAATLVSATPANAAACTNVGAAGSYASAYCTGTGWVQLNVRCNAIWPFTPWTDYGTRIYIRSPVTLANYYQPCAASVTVWVVYG